MICTRHFAVTVPVVGRGGDCCPALHPCLEPAALHGAFGDPTPFPLEKSTFYDSA